MKKRLLEIQIENLCIDLAQKANQSLNLKCCAVDILDTHDGPKILEINSGVALEKFASFSKENLELSQKIYSKCLFASFDLLK